MIVQKSEPDVDYRYRRELSLPRLSEVLATAGRLRLALLTALVAPALVALAASKIVVPQYQATAKLLVQSGREHLPRSDTQNGGTEIGPQTTMLDTINTEIEIMTGSDLLRDVVRKQKIDILFPGFATNQAPGVTSEDAAMKLLRSALDVEPVKLSNVIGVSLRNSDSHVAVETLRTLLAGFQQRHLEAFSSDRTSLLQKRLEDTLEQLASLEKERAAYMQTEGLFSFNDQRMMLLAQRAKDVQALQDAQIQRDALTGQVAFMREQLAKQPEQITLQTTSSESNLAQDNEKHLRDLERQRRELTAFGYMERNAALAKIDAALTATREFAKQTSNRSTAVAVGVNPIVITMRNQLTLADAELEPLSGRVTALHLAEAKDEKRLAQLSASEVRLADLDRHIAQLDAATAMLRQRLEDARYLSDLDSAKIGSIRVIQQPTALSKPIYPNKVLFVLVGILVGVVGFLSVLLTALTFRVRVIVADTVERILGVPVFATLPAISQRDMRRLVSPKALAAPAVTER